jgi:hypothetical protein
MRRRLPRKLFSNAEDRARRRPDHKFRPGSELSEPRESVRLEKLEGRILLSTCAFHDCLISGYN